MVFFLSVKSWHPNFVASEAKETSSAIWVRQPELPTEFYDHQILAKVGKKLGKLVKTDVCTSATLRGRYARICVEVPIGIPVKKQVTIGNHKQQLVYKVKTSYVQVAVFWDIQLYHVTSKLVGGNKKQHTC